MKNFLWFLLLPGIVGFCAGNSTGQDKKGPGPARDNVAPAGFRLLFNGKNLDNWQGVIPITTRAKLSPEDLQKRQKAANEKILPHWIVKDGVLYHDGKGDHLQTAKDYGNIDLLVDWKIAPKGDSGIYLRGNPQVQIWDYSEPGFKKFGAHLGSGGLWNNARHPKDPLVLADNPIGQWNTMYIVMKGDKVTVKLNGKLVVDNTPLENYWERSKPLPTHGPIELQHHDGPLWFKNIYIKELPN